MPRIKGAVDADHHAKKSRLQERLLRALAKAKGRHPSYRELAVAAGVSQTTLRHYFGGMDDLIVGIFQDFLRAGRPHIGALSRPSGPFPKSITDAVRHMAFGMRLQGLHFLRAVGQAEGIRRDRVGAAYLQAFIDPCVRAVQERLEAHVRKGEMRKCSSRAAAISLVAPIVFVFQHQDDFGGRKHSPLAINPFLKVHSEAFIRAFSCSTSKTSSALDLGPGVPSDY